MDSDDLKSTDNYSKHLIGYLLDNRFEILSAVSSGGFGDVLKVRHHKTDRVCAAKVMRQKVEPTPESLKRFQREAQIMCKLRHPNIVAVRSFGLDEQLGLFLIMDWLDGVPLSNLLLSAGLLSADRALKFFVEICDGMSSAHDVGILHRDIKPGNIMIVGTGAAQSAIIIDFGAGKVLDGGLDQKLTSTGALLGTPLYMSPEQCLSKDADKRSDVYAMGCLMYEVLTGKCPFDGESSYEILSKHLHEIPPLPSVANSTANISPQLDQAVARALQKDPNDRLATFSELKAALLDDLKPPFNIRSRPHGHGKGAAFQAKKLLIPVAVGAFAVCLLTVSMAMRSGSNESGRANELTVFEMRRLRQMLWDQRDYRAADELSKQVIEFYHSRPDLAVNAHLARLDRARFKYEEGNVTEAKVILAELDKQERKYPLNAGQVKYSYGQALFLLHEMPAARDTLLWLRHNNNDISEADRWKALYLLTKCYIEVGDYTIAAKFAEEALQRASDDSQLRRSYGRIAEILRKTGQPKLALARALEGAKTKPDSTAEFFRFDHPVELALDYNATGDLEKARLAKKKILSDLGPRAESDSEGIRLLRQRIEDDLSVISPR